MVKIVPLKIVVMLIAHHTPFTSICDAKSIAKGILIALNVMLIMAGGAVLPIPLNIPWVVNSSIINI